MSTPEEIARNREIRRAADTASESTQYRLMMSQKRNVIFETLEEKIAETVKVLESQGWPTDRRHDQWLPDARSDAVGDVFATVNNEQRLAWKIDRLFLVNSTLEISGDVGYRVFFALGKLGRLETDGQHAIIYDYDNIEIYYGPHDRRYESPILQFPSPAKNLSDSVQLSSLLRQLDILQERARRWVE